MFKNVLTALDSSGDQASKFADQAMNHRKSPNALSALEQAIMAGLEKRPLIPDDPWSTVGKHAQSIVATMLKRKVFIYISFMKSSLSFLFY